MSNPNRIGKDLIWWFSKPQVRVVVEVPVSLRVSVPVRLLFRITVFRPAIKLDSFVINEKSNLSFWADWGRENWAS